MRVDGTVILYRRQQDLSPANERQVGGEHYRHRPIQPWDYIVANNIPFLEGSAIKHITRHREKAGRQDLEKAIHYLQKALETYYPLDNSAALKLSVSDSQAMPGEEKR